ncbi:MAG: threonine synthase [Planctomycetota bacterium]|jgi:threonine synthase
MTIYYSTNRKVPEVTLDEALLQGQAGDKGLFLPRPIPTLSKDLLARARDLPYPALASAVLEPYMEGVFSPEELKAICEDAYDFDVPLEKVEARRHVMRLDQGPTASFKDFAAKFMGRALGQLVRRRGKPLLILTATSGDTGSAIAHAFFGVEGIRVLVLFPRKEVSDRQRKQMTTVGDNVATVAVEGKFDDCQALVKQAFADPDLTALNLSSANSINIGRLLPQSVYYVYAAAKVADLPGGEKPIFSVPSGNFGDLVGGMLALKSGLPVSRVVMATNANDEVPRFLASGLYEKIVPSRVCLSNAMNVGHPSNLARLVDLYGGWMDELGNLLEPPDMEAMRKDLYGVSIDDAATKRTIQSTYEKHGVMLEPHGAVGWAGLLRYIEQYPEMGGLPAISLETAHPAKFPDQIRALTGVDPALPPSLEGIEERPEHFGEMEVDYSAFKDLLIKDYSR